MAMVKNTSPIVATILAQVLFFSLVDCFAGDYNTSPKIRINYLSQNSGKQLINILLVYIIIILKIENQVRNVQWN